MNEIIEKFNKIVEKFNEKFSPTGKKILLGLLILGVVALLLLVVGLGKSKTQQPETVAELPSIEDISIEEQKVELEEIAKDIDIVEETEEDKTVVVAVETVGRADPFLPSSESISNTMKYGFELMAPPEELSSEDSEAAKVMTTKVSGIMYNDNNSSAILNIEGSDYLVRSGDYIHKYKVLAIASDSVTVQLGNNIYKAKVGEIITESLKHNTIDNLQNKFGGASN